MDDFNNELRPLLVRFKAERIGAERFGDWCDRVFLKENPTPTKAASAAPAATLAPTA